MKPNQARWSTLLTKPLLRKYGTLRPVHKSGLLCHMPSVIDFYADWCAPCRKIAPIMEKLAKEYDGQLKVYKIDVDVERKLAGVFQVRSIPAVMFTPKTGQPMMQAGALTEEMYVKIVEEELLGLKKD